MHTIQPLTRVASFSGPLSPSNTVLGKRRALADDEGDIDQPDVKRAKGVSAILGDDWDARANKENIPPFARALSRRPATLSRRASTGPGPGTVGAAPSRLRRSFSYASPSTPKTIKLRDDSLSSALPASSSP